MTTRNGCEVFREALERGGCAPRRRGATWAAHCPAHEDGTPSLSFRPGDNGAQVVATCHAGCNWASILEALSLSPDDRATILGKSPRETRAQRRRNAPRSEWVYRDEEGVPLFRVCRADGPDGKHIWQEKPDGTRGLGGVRRIVYRLPEVLRAIEAGQTIYIVEGEKCADAVAALGLCATTNPMGAGKWREEYSESFRGARAVRVLSDNDGADEQHPENGRKGQRHAEEVARSLSLVGVSDIRVVHFPEQTKPDGSAGGDVADWLAARCEIPQEPLKKALLEFIERAPRWVPSQRLPQTPSPRPQACSLAEVVVTFRKWMHLPDLAPLLAVLAAVQANRMEGDPVWLLLVAPPGSGKTELLESTRTVPGMHSTATLTEPALLSGTRKAERAKESTGGLLREIGAQGIILFKDFGSVLSMHRDARSSVLAALREIYDGSWTRRLGTDGGTAYQWTGRVGLIAGCTPIIDSHHSVMASLGERFLQCRMTDTGSIPEVRLALAHTGRESTMRRELQDVVAKLLAGLPNRYEAPGLPEAETQELVSIASFACRCRSAVERDSYSREIELIPGQESPTRLAKALRRLFEGAMALGCEHTMAWGLVRRVALDCIPSKRLAALKALARLTEAAPDLRPETSTIARELGLPTNTTRRTLEDLEAYRLVQRFSAGKGNSDGWTLGHGLEPRGYLAPTSEAGVPETSAVVMNDWEQV